MNKNAVAVGAIVVLLVLVVLLRPRGGATHGESYPAVAARPSETPPPDLRRPSTLPALRKRADLPTADQEVPMMAPPPIAEDAGETDAPTPEAVPSGERSAWPLTFEGIQGAVHEALPELTECYDGWLAEDPELAGRIVASLTISEVDGIGQITSAEVEEATTGHAAFEACVTSVLSELQFDSPGAGRLSVTYPFLFATDAE
ncbi:MAG: hypothetical protein EP330_21005 [Deltaproteobacteria bacterium]|nr:MAG: hypothetical protein EP330_21005 [Deltaproteobacteria bacterium]